MNAWDCIGGVKLPTPYILMYQGERYMRSIVLLIMTFVYAAAADPFAGLQYTDGKARSAADFAGQPVVVIYACGH